MAKFSGMLFGALVIIGIVGCGGGSSTPPPTPTPTPVTQTFPNDQASAQAAPVKLGTSGANANDLGATVCCIGTLGSLWTKTGVTRPVILSNNHVLNRSDSGKAVPGTDPINQPLPLACTPKTSPPPLTVAILTQGAKLKPVANEPGACPGSTAPLCGHAPSNVDAAIAEIVSGQVDLSGTILDLGPVGASSITPLPPSSTIGVAALGQAVGKSGRTTGLTCSTVQSLSASIQVDYEATCGDTTPAFTAIFTNQMVVGGGNFSASGDSGSLIVTTDTARAVSLLYGGNSVSTVANPILDVQNAFGGPAAFTIVGGADHAVSCAHNTTASSTTVGTAQAALLPQEQQRVGAVQKARSQSLMRDFGIASVETGASADNPSEGALVLHISGKSVPAVPAVIDGVRTRLVFDDASAANQLASIGAQQVSHATAVKEAHVSEFLGKPGIQGVGVSISADNPTETAISIYVVKGTVHPVIPATIDGVRTRIFEGDRFRAS